MSRYALAFSSGLRLEKAMDFVTDRLNGVDGLGAIFPAIANTIMAFDALAYPHDQSEFANAREALRRLLILKDDFGYCQPCVSPVWDTGLASHALLEADVTGQDSIASRATEWLCDRQILDVVGDWSTNRGNLRPGGWAFSTAMTTTPTSTIPQWSLWLWTARIAASTVRQ